MTQFTSDNPRCRWPEIFAEAADRSILISHSEFLIELLSSRILDFLDFLHDGDGLLLSVLVTYWARQLR